MSGDQWRSRSACAKARRRAGSKMSTVLRRLGTTFWWGARCLTRGLGARLLGGGATATPTVIESSELRALADALWNVEDLRHCGGERSPDPKVGGDTLSCKMCTECFEKLRPHGACHSPCGLSFSRHDNESVAPAPGHGRRPSGSEMQMAPTPQHPEGERSPNSDSRNRAPRGRSPPATVY